MEKRKNFCAIRRATC